MLHCFLVTHKNNTNFLKFCFFGCFFQPSDYIGVFQTVAALILTMVTFLFVISDNLPNVQYLTLLDKFGYSCFGNMFCIAFVIAIGGRLHTTNQTVWFIFYFCVFFF